MSIRWLNKAGVNAPALNFTPSKCCTHAHNRKGQPMNDNGKNAVITYQEPAKPSLGTRDELQVQDVIVQVQKILEIKKAVMKSGEHYGTIPGTQKPTLLKAGAEKLALTFRFAPKFNVTVTPLQGDHREYSCACTLTHIHSGNLIAEGVGSCNSMESKYRYRKADPEPVGPVPKAYWQEKNEAKKSNIIGGRGFGVKKIENAWMIVRYSDQKVEHGNPADFYNTCLKMAKKRAFVDAVITATGGSDIFTQDMEDSVEDEPEPPRSTPPTPTQQSSKSPRAPIEVQAHEAPPNLEPPEWPEEPSEAETLPPAETTANNAKSQASPAPASEKTIGDLENLLIEWRSKAIEADPKMGSKRFDGVLQAQLKLHRVQRFDQLSRDAQEKVFASMRMVTEGMFPMPSSGKKPSKLAEKLNALAQNATANE